MEKFSNLEITWMKLQKAVPCKM